MVGKEDGGDNLQMFGFEPSADPGSKRCFRSGRRLFSELPLSSTTSAPTSSSLGHDEHDRSLDVGHDFNGDFNGERSGTSGTCLDLFDKSTEVICGRNSQPGRTDG